MSLPTVHFARFTGTLGAGASITIPHTLKTGQFPAGVAPHAVLADMNTGVYTAPPNVSIGCYAANDVTNVYLSNFDGASAHAYALVARRYHSIDGANL